MLDIAQSRGLVGGFISRPGSAHEMENPMIHTEMLEDINAMASEALTALEENRLADVRVQLRAILVMVREAIDDAEQA
jgi:hypothetical protein